ncbi:hypothetical protein JAAARDRAFT_199847 [Jaapia argillacea MUCL 33604]|uniref:Uncharacterized protein n=1 Tax=Jaapia argillacea MUCL 33604 TaxID=933084 RepID=A0A067PJG1_9AGAM|nr:hypothetical protein JAAARDRAFT_199847 [Jaapia argillacea MUCL 33604]
MSLIVLNFLTSNSRHATIQPKHYAPCKRRSLGLRSGLPLLVFTSSYLFPAQPNPGYHASVSFVVALPLKVAPDYVKGEQFDGNAMEGVFTDELRQTHECYILRPNIGLRQTNKHPIDSNLG